MRNQGVEDKDDNSLVAMEQHYLSQDYVGKTWTTEAKVCLKFKYKAVACKKCPQANNSGCQQKIADDQLKPNQPPGSQ